VHPLSAGLAGAVAGVAPPLPGSASTVVLAADGRRPVPEPASPTLRRVFFDEGCRRETEGASVATEEW